MKQDIILRRVVECQNFGGNNKQKLTRIHINL